MNSILNLDSISDCIIHFRPEEGRGLSRLVLYQVRINPDKLSPSGEYIRFNSDQNCEVHGWVKVEDIVIDELLESNIKLEKVA